MTYSIVNVFGTIQGEGALAGTPATFIRLAGCNMWSGIEAHRIRDANRLGARCPVWCDTDFRARERLSAAEIADRAASFGDRPLLVITGGEPMLQFDDDLIMALRKTMPRSRIAIETNGTVHPAITLWGANLWVTMSPKLSRADTKLTNVDELKLVWPAHDPDDWLSFPARHRFIQPQGHPDGTRAEAMELAAASYVVNHPDWRLSLQTHKILGIP